MAMSRKHYVAIAEAVNKTATDRIRQRRMGGALANIFADDNPKFDYARFMKACTEVRL